jgi:hypothetical protein
MRCLLCVYAAYSVPNNDLWTSNRLWKYCLRKSCDQPAKHNQVSEVRYVTTSYIREHFLSDNFTVRGELHCKQPLFTIQSVPSL